MSSLPVGLDLEQLVTTGRAMYSTQPGLIAVANEQAQWLINSYKHLPAEERSFTRRGEPEPDLGLIAKDGQDKKLYLHYAPDLQSLRAGGLRAEPMGLLAHLWENNLTDALEIARRLQKAYPDHFPFLLTSQIEKANRTFSPGFTATLRALQYLEGGAGRHPDRGFIAQHMGGLGGDLVFYDSPEDTTGTVVQVPEGQVLVFFGVGAMRVTRGFVHSVWHGSSVRESGVKRTALVQFTHAPFGKPIYDAKAEDGRLRKQYGL